MEKILDFRTEMTGATEATMQVKWKLVHLRGAQMPTCLFLTEVVQHSLLWCLQGVTYSKQDAQQAVQRLMNGNAVLVGHALHHDLHALQLDPIAVIDTSLICSYRHIPPDSIQCCACSYKY